MIKLAPLTFWISGISFGLVGVATGVILSMPKNAEVDMLEERTEQLNAEAAKMKQAQDNAVKATELVEQEAGKWRAVVATRAPRPSVEQGGIDLSVNGWQLSVDTRKFRNSIQRAVNAQLKTGGVTVVNGPLVPAPDANALANSLLSTYYSYGTYTFPVVVLNLGSVTVEGTYEQIMNNVRGWSRMPRYLAIADGLTISGTTPRFTGTYNLQVVGFIRGKDIFPVVPEAGGGSTGGSSFGGPSIPGGGRGPGSGSPFSPPGMPGGPGGPGGPGAGYSGGSSRPGGPSSTPPPPGGGGRRGSQD